MKARPSRRWWLALGLLTGYAVACFVPYLAPFARYPVYYLKCGGQPIIATDFAAAYSYQVPGDDLYGADIFTSAYFCTEEQAQAAGYRRGSL